MKKRTAIFRGIAGLSAFLLMVTVTGTNLLFTYSGVINNALNVQTSRIVQTGESEPQTIYDNPYGTDITNKQSALKVETAVASENIAQAEEGCVLLKNDDQALPLSVESRITVFGNGSFHTQGTSNTTAFEAIPPVTYTDSLKTAFGEGNVNLELESVYASLGSTSNTDISEAAISDVKAKENSWKSDYNDAAVVMLSRTGSESNDSAMITAEGRHYLGLSQNEEELMDYLAQEKADGIFDRIIVLINADQMMELDWLDDYDVDACMIVGLPGAVGFTGVANILTGKTVPSGHLVDTYAADSLSAPANIYAGDNTQKFTNSEWLNTNATDNTNDGDNIDWYVIYAEGIYVGYKYYETRYEDLVMKAGNADSVKGSSTKTAWNYQDEVCYPFGHGLSYTEFEKELTGVEYDEVKDQYLVNVKVSNTGDYTGKTVVQVYAQTPYGDYEKENLVEKSAVSLVGFEKTDALAPGESMDVTVTVDGYFLASYDAKGAEGYILSAGDYFLSIGENAHDALNNILAAKGYSAADGMSAEGDAAMIYQWNQAALDQDRYRMSNVNDEVEVTNAFDYADLNYYNIDFTYLSRNDWDATWPEQLSLEANESIKEALNTDWYTIPEDAPAVSDFTQGTENGITFADMANVEWEDEETWNAFIDQLTVEEMAGLMLDAEGTQGIDHIGMPFAGRNDDGNGIGSALTAVGGSGMGWVSEVMTSRTWNKDRFNARGENLAFEAAYCGLTEIWYGGGNVHRTAVAGRNNQYYSEDANFGYYVGAGEAKAMQDNGIIYCIKHFVLNDQETHREGLNTFCNEQALRENYLRAFEGAITKGGAKGVMTAFSRLGARQSATCPELLNGVLKSEWGFKGHVTTDGYSGSSAYKTHYLEELASGLDYSCLDSTDHAAAVIAAINAGDGYALELLRRAAKHNLYAISRTVAENGLSSDSRVITVVPGWQSGLLMGTLVLIVVFGASVIMMFTGLFAGKKKEGTNEIEKI